MSFAAPSQVPKNEQGYGLMTARRRAKLERMLEKEIARDATSKRLQAMLGKTAGSSQAVKKTVRPRAFVRGARRDARMDGWTPRGLHLIVGSLGRPRCCCADVDARVIFSNFQKRKDTKPPTTVACAKRRAKCVPRTCCLSGGWRTCLALPPPR